MKKTLVIAVAAALAFTYCETSHADGWLKRASGGRISTPKPIRNIAPKGLSFTPRENSPSYIQVVTPPSIDANGNVYSGSGSGGSRGRYVGKATIVRNSRGQAYWRSSYSNRYGRAQTRRAPSRYDRSVSRPRPTTTRPTSTRPRPLYQPRPTTRPQYPRPTYTRPQPKPRVQIRTAQYQDAAGNIHSVVYNGNVKISDVIVRYAALQPQNFQRPRGNYSIR